jgi:predicted Zn-dependent protease
MLLFGSVAAAVVAAGTFAAWWWLRRRRLTLANSIGLVALGLWAGAVAIKLYVDHADERARAALTADSIAWPIQEPLPTLSPASTSGAGAQVRAAPVESLIGGLEARLAAEPDDAAGWTLLAQSYAFVANREGAETAVQRAVALGVDEAALRERVQGAERSAAPVDWVEATLRDARERRRRAAESR